MEDDNAALSCGRAQAELAVFVAGQPALRIDRPTQVCVNQEVGYAMTGDAEQARWDFGAGLKAEGKEVNVRFPQAGTREIHTVVDGQPGPSQTVHVLGLPELALPKQLSVLAGEETNITPALLDKTSVPPQFSWDSGDGRTQQRAQYSGTITPSGCASAAAQKGQPVLPLRRQLP